MIARHCPASILVPRVAERSVAMPLDYDKLLNWRPPEVRQKLTRKDTIRYALGLGLGADPMDERQLRFVYEKDLLTLPTIATVLASPEASAGADRTGSALARQKAEAVIFPNPGGASVLLRRRLGPGSIRQKERMGVECVSWLHCWCSSSLRRRTTVKDKPG
jgi:hypothetical protein